MKKKEFSSYGHRGKRKRRLRNAMLYTEKRGEIGGHKGRRDRECHSDGGRSEISAPLPILGEGMPLAIREEPTAHDRESGEQNRLKRNRILPVLASMLPALGASVLILSIFLLRAAWDGRTRDGQKPESPQQNGQEAVSAGEMALWELYEKRSPSAVTVLCDRDGRERRCGGFVLREDGYIVTVLQELEGAERIRVRLWDGREHTAELVAADALTELVLLRISVGGLTALEMEDAATSEIGQSVTALVSSSGGGAAHLMTGRVSANKRQVLICDRNRTALKQMLLLPTDLDLTETDVGSPLFDQSGALLGILLRAGEDGRVGYAILARDAESILEAMLRREPLTDALRSVMAVKAPSVGIVALPEENGVRVMGFSSDAAALGGLRQGDLITHVNGVAVGSLAEINDEVARAAWGGAVEITLRRGTQRLSFSIPIQ